MYFAAKSWRERHYSVSLTIYSVSLVGLAETARQPHISCQISGVGTASARHARNLHLQADSERFRLMGYAPLKVKPKLFERRTAPVIVSLYLRVFFL